MKRFDVAVFCGAALYLLLRVPEPRFFIESTDQGYQMALGVTLLHGGVPGLNVFTQYGPLVALASAVGMLIAPGAVGEAVICALGYAAAIAVAASLLRQRAGSWVAAVAAAVLLVLFPRYYKWYYWLWPLVGLRFGLRYGFIASPTALWMVVWGASAGIAGLFRYDLGLFSTLFGLAVIGFGASRLQRAAGRLRDGCIFLAAAALPPLSFGAGIAGLRGVGGLAMLLRSVLDGTGDSVGAYGIAPFAFSAAPLMSPGNALALLQLLLPAVAFGALVLGWCRRGPEDGYSLFCAAVASLGIFPQALHRADAQHLLQVLPCVVVMLGLLWQTRPLAGLIIIPLLGACFLLPPGLGADLGPILRDQPSTWRQLAHLPDSMRGNAVADMAMAIRDASAPEARVFLTMPLTPASMLFFAGRRAPGLFPIYEPGMFASPYWVASNEAALRHAPPDFLVTDVEPAGYVPGLVKSWQTGCTIRVHQNSRFILYRCALSSLP